MAVVMEMTRNENTRLPASERAIELRVAGADLLLGGRFHHWMPVTLIQAKDNEGLAQILFDVTSTGAVNEHASQRPLFEFKASSVKSTGAQSYNLKGRLKAGIYAAETEAVLESPRGHTPFFAITFTINREKFQNLWAALEERAARAIANGEEELRPWAWLREPQLAAA